MLVHSHFGNLPPPPDINFHNILLRRPDQQGWKDHMLFIDITSGERVRFSEFRKRVVDGATVLAAPTSQGGLGLKAENQEIIGILGEILVDYFTLIHSALMIATPFVPFSAYSTPYEFAHALRTSKATRLFVQGEQLEKVLKVAKQVGFPLDRIYTLDGRSAGDGSGRRDFGEMIDEVRRRDTTRVGVRPAKRDTLAYLLFSSGTSGLPKAVMVSHGNLIASVMQGQKVAEEVVKVNGIPKYDTPEGVPITLTFLPLHHTMGLNVYGFRSFMIPTTMVLLRKWDTETALRTIQDFRVTNMALVPSLVHQLVHYPKINRYDLSSIVYLGSGGAYLPPVLGDQLLRVSGIKITAVQEGYGMSETILTSIARPIDGILNGKLKSVRASTGVLLPGITARIVREDGSEADYNEPGELYLKGGNIAMGYWNNEKANQETFVDGWLRTGDRFRVDKEGYFFFEDRAKDTLKVSGVQVSPTEIEAVLLDQPEKLISDVSVAGVSGGRTNDEKVPRAWIVLTDAGRKKGEPYVVQALDEWSRKNLSKYKWLRGGFEVINEIPKSPTGKVLRRVLQDDFEKKLKTRSKL